LTNSHGAPWMPNLEKASSGVVCVVANPDRASDAS